MPKQKYIIRDFSGGMNTKRDPRDISQNESSLLVNFSIDAIGKLKTAGGFYNHIESNDGSTDLTRYISNCDVGNIIDSSDPTISGAGFGAFYFESDHGLSNTNTITDTKHPGTSDDLVIGASNGNIQFNQTSTTVDIAADIPSYNTE